jgi:hypothetical protein
VIGLLLGVLFYLALPVAVGAIIAGAWVHPRWYWLAAGLIYFDSFLSGFSIGLYLLSLAFALSALALGHSMGWVRRFWHSAFAIGVGVVLWYAAVSMIDDFWLFLPFTWLF